MIFGLADWLFYYLIFQYAGIGFFVVYWVWNSRFKIANIAVFYRNVRKDLPINDFGEPDLSKRSYVWVGEKQFGTVDQGVNFRKIEFPVDMSLMSSRKFGFTFYAFDIDTKEQLCFGGQTLGTKVDIDKYVVRGIWSQLLAKVGGLDKVTLVLFIVIIIVAAVASVAGGYMFGSSGNHTVYT